MCFASLRWKRGEGELSPLPWKVSFPAQPADRTALRRPTQESGEFIKFLLLLFSKSYLFAWDDFWELIRLSAVTMSYVSEAGKEGKPLQ